jgi:hypothetical protein
VDLLLDVGCATNVLDLDSAIEAQLDIVPANNVSLVDAAGNNMAIAGQSLVNVEVPTRTRSSYIRFIISPDLPHKESGLLGKVALQTLGYLPPHWPDSQNFRATTVPPRTRPPASTAGTPSPPPPPHQTHQRSSPQRHSTP